MPVNATFTRILELCAASELPEVYQHRVPDYKQPKDGKSLFKNKSAFFKNPTGQAPVGSNGALGEHFKKKESKPDSRYYLAERMNYREYFTYELLNALGLQTPKTRLIAEGNEKYVATSSFQDFIPMIAVLDIDTNEADYTPTKNDAIYKGSHSHLKGYVKKDSFVEKIVDRYHFRTKTQAIHDNESNNELPVRGFLSAAQVIADYLQDRDIDLEGWNAGVLRKPNSFEFVLIDKQGAQWNPNTSTQDLVKFNYNDTPLAHVSTEDQKTAVLYQMANLFVERNGKRLVDDIYFNPRANSVAQIGWAHQAAYICLGGLVEGMEKNNIPVHNEQIEILIKRFVSLAEKSLPPQITSDNADKTTSDLVHILNEEVKKVIAENKYPESILQNISEIQATQAWLVNSKIEINAMEKHVAMLFEKNAITPEKFAAYIEREKIREQLAEKVIQQFSGLDAKELKLMKRNIVEDLRGNRFNKHFADQNNKTVSGKDIENEALMTALKDSFTHEFAITKTPTLRM